MNYLVVLDVRSPIGAIYNRKADTNVPDAEAQLSHPALLCSDVSIDHPTYLFATRPLKGDKSHQSLHIPHHAVVAIYRVNEEDAAPMGFPI
ncbi:hypothetical protein [Caballeronia sp. LZ035]|uniref:hypothetical protein n=1 Tax=Caballeronia sp. LZ035 TaxID=3038568 RepID=UPI00285BB5F4|nr:hypothetical protein [Caballeronia sp. LZ035]MDR5756479.1 hypothetical protein [Caballeronia sp. LZ035]